RRASRGRPDRRRTSRCAPRRTRRRSCTRRASARPRAGDGRVLHSRERHSRERESLPRVRTDGPVTFVQAMMLAVLQGVSELFPVSSLGHTVLVPALLRWGVDEGSESFLAFVVVLHLGTALALIVFYRNDWIAIVRAFVASVVRGRFSDDPHERTAWLR